MKNTTETPTAQSFNLPGVVHIEPKHAVIELTDSDAFIVDIREDEELDIVQFDTTQLIHMPMSSIMDNFVTLPKDKPLIIACNNGIRSTKIVNLLNIQGFTNAVNLDGGIAQWYRDTLPIIVKTHEEHNHGGCGCSCEGGCC
jgi:rhodanese-related sulfurtransferase